MCPKDEATLKPRLKNLPMVFALVGLSTITSFILKLFYAVKCSADVIYSPRKLKNSQFLIRRFRLKSAVREQKSGACRLREQIQQIFFVFADFVNSGQIGVIQTKETQNIFRRADHGRAAL